MKEFDVYRITRRLGIKDISNIEKIFKNLVIRSDEGDDVFFGYNLLLQILRQKITLEEQIALSYLMGYRDGNNEPIKFKFENNRGL